MRYAVAAYALFALLPPVGQAAFTDFSDYTQRQTFATGEIFQSKGLAFKALDWRATGPFPITNPVIISVSQSVNYHALHPGPGVEFLLPPSIQEVSLSYVDGAGSVIAINGIEPTYPNPRTAGFSFLDGTSLAGVGIATSVTRGSRTHEEGFLTLRGPINSLAIAGLELSLDHVTVLVPEPSAAALALVAAAVATTAYRPRRELWSLRNARHVH